MTLSTNHARFLTRNPITWWVQQLLAVAVFVLGTIVLFGWVRHDVRMTRLFIPGFAPATYVVAVGTVLSAVALSLLAFDQRKIAAALGTAPFLYGVLALLEVGFNWHLGIDTVPFLIVRDTAVHADGGAHLSVPGAIAFALVGIGLWLNAIAHSRRRLLIVALVGGFLAALGAVGFVGYASGIATSYATVAYHPMSGLAAVDALLLGIGFVVQAWRDEAPTVGAPRWIPLLIGISGVVGTLILWQAITALERAHIQQLVGGKGAEMRDVVEAQIQTRAAALQRIARRWEFGTRKSRLDWERDVALHVHDYGGYKAIQWVDPQFRIRWIVPTAGNESMLNRNSAMDTARRIPLIEARDRNIMTMTSAISLMTGGTGFRIHVPLRRHERFDGFIVGVIQSETFFNLILKDFVKSGYDVAVMDGDRVLYRGHADDAGTEAALTVRARSYRQSIRLHLPKPTWHLQVTPQPHLVAQLHSPLASVVAFGGFAISLALAFLAYLAHTARLRNVRLRQEIREREAKERVLQQSELRFRSVTESANDAIISADADGHILSWNQGAQRMFGYAAVEIVGKSLSRLMPERYRAAHEQGIARVAHSGHSRIAGQTLELEGLRKNGETFPIEISIATWKASGEVLASGIIRDITDRKRNEVVLRERERQLLSAEKLAHLGSWEWEIASDRVMWSDELYRIYGLAPQAEPVNYASFLMCVHPDDRARVEKAIAESYRSKAPFSFDHRVIRPDGSERTLRATGEVITDEHGQPIRMIGAGLDVTEQQRAEDLLREAEAVRKSEQHFRVLADSAPVLIWMADRDGNGSYFNKTWLEFTGRSDIQENGDGWRQAWHPDDRERVTAVYRDALARHRPFAVEQRLQYRDGTYRWVLNHGVPRFVRNEFAGLVGSCVDIHERKQAEEQRAALLEAERRARADAEAARNRLVFVAEVSALLAQNLDYEQALKDFGRAAVPRIADWCAIDLANDDGSVRRMHVVHDDPEKVRLAFELSANYPSPPDSRHGSLYVLRSGKTDWAADVTRGILEVVAHDVRHLEILRTLDLRSYIAAPLISRGRTLGVITFVMAESKRRYREDDVVYIEDLARRCAVAVDNARLYQSSQAEVAERLSAEESLAAEKERLAVTLHSIGDGVITVDTASRVVLLNKVGEQLTGWSQAQARGRPLTEVFNIVNEKTRKEVSSPVAQVLRTGEIAALANHTVLIARDGRERAIADSGAPIHDGAGNIIGVVLVFRDVTEQQRMEQELTKARNLEAIGLLAGGIAHDFNNILTAILGNIALAKMYGESNSRVTDVLNEAEKAFWRARDLTQQLLTFAKGGAPIKKTASVRELLTDTASFALRGGNVRLEFAIADDLWPAEFDRGQISQVINNLVLNAKQAMPGGGTLHIRAANVRLDGNTVPVPAGDYLRIEVGDTGTGIPEKHLAKIFDPYFTTKQKGSGLGLAIAYSIIAKHEGHIDVRSTVGVGTTFSIYLPALPEAETVDSDIVEFGRHDGSGKRVLVMDDEAPVRQVLESLLTGINYDVVCAQDGDEVLRIYAEALKQQRRFDIVVMDLTVPGGMGGRECIAKLLKIDPNVCAIVSSGYSNDPVMANYADYGFCGVVAKPYQMRELSFVLHRLATDSQNNRSISDNG